MIDTARARIDAGSRAQSALDEFLSPAFDTVISHHVERIQAIASKEPWEAGKIAKLSQAVMIAEEVKSQILAIVLDGKVAEKEMAKRLRIEKMPEERRKILGMSLPTT